MRPIAAAMLAWLVTGCATQRVEPQAAVRSRPPSNYHTTIGNYFDVHMREPQVARRLAFAPPESSDCALRGSAGAYKAWRVPVIYDNSASTSASGPRGAAKTRTAAAAAVPGAPAPRASASGTAAADGVVSFDEVQVSGKGYFFWFTHDTISAVTRRADHCP